LDTQQTKPVVSYDSASLVGNHAVVKLGEVLRLTTAVVRLEEDGEFETLNTIYRKATE